MAAFFWYLVKDDLSSVHVYISVHWTSHFFQVTRNMRPCLTDLLVGANGWQERDLHRRCDRDPLRDRDHPPLRHHPHPQEEQAEDILKALK